MLGIRSRLQLQLMLREIVLYSVREPGFVEGIVFVNKVINTLVMVLPGGVGLLCREIFTQPVT